MELLLSNHRENCPNCQNKLYCPTGEKIKEFHLKLKYRSERINQPIHKMATAAEIDPNACIACNNCVLMCQRIGIGFLELDGRGSKAHATYKKNPKIDCIYCGQCTAHCPVNAAREQSQIAEVEKALGDKNKIVIAQAAPSIRTTIGEGFDRPFGENLTGEMYTAMRRLGFDHIFDVNMGADITTIVEAKELAKRLKGSGKLPMFTSCCPGWVKFVEFYHPELIGNLTTARSPQIHSGGAYKSWWAEKMKIDPKKIVVVSIMPCTSKKYEANNHNLFIGKLKPVDFVLTTREFITLLKKHDIDLPKLEESKVDQFGEYSGAAAIYGASGGVMESALRSTYFNITGKELDRVEFSAVRGMKGVKRAEVNFGGRKVKVAVAATVANAKILISEIKKNPNAYDYIEVMACPGGCIGGGGQPVSGTNRIIEKRIEGLYKIDDQMKIRKAHQNPIVKDYFENYIKNIPPRKSDQLLHRKYKKKNKFY
jgi:iron-only hydrogenase group A